MGSLPLLFTPLLESIQFHYATRILPTIEQSSHHIYTTNILFPELQENLCGIIHQPLWTELCPSGSWNTSCQVTPVIEMNELYFTHPGYAKQRRYLYGTAVHAEENTDTIFPFPYTRLYRVLIGLSNENNHTYTYFPAWNKGIFLHRGDYVVYDVYRTRRRQRITTPCLLPSCPPFPRPHFHLAFQFLVYDPSIYSFTMIHYLSRVYLYYNYMTRWIIAIGTDPVAYYEYVMGWLIQLYIAPYVAHTMVGITFFTFLILRHASYSMTTSFFYSFLSPLLSILLLALEDWATDTAYRIHHT